MSHLGSPRSEGGPWQQGPASGSLSLAAGGPSWLGNDRAPGRQSGILGRHAFLHAESSTCRGPSAGFPWWSPGWTMGSVPDSLHSLDQACPALGLTPHLCNEWCISEGLSGPLEDSCPSLRHPSLTPGPDGVGGAGPLGALRDPGRGWQPDRQPPALRGAPPVCV